MKNLVKNLLPDVLISTGAALVGFGVYSIYKPAGLICWGVMFIFGAIILIKGGGDD